MLQRIRAGSRDMSTKWTALIVFSLLMVYNSVSRMDLPEPYATLFTVVMSMVVVALIGQYAGRYVAINYHDPRYKRLIWPRLGEGRIGMYDVPEALFRYLGARGNSHVFMTDTGADAYLVKDFNFETMKVVWGDAHEYDPLTVASNFDSYLGVREDYTDTKMKYLKILSYPEVLAAGLTSTQLKIILDALMAEVKITETDLRSAAGEARKEASNVCGQ
jgi:hypothetical protein